MQDYLRQTERHLLVSGVRGDVLKVFRNSGLLRHIGEENVFPAEANPNLATRKALLRARALLGGEISEVRLYYESDQPLPKSA